MRAHTSRLHSATTIQPTSASHSWAPLQRMPRMSYWRPPAQGASATKPALKPDSPRVPPVTGVAQTDRKTSRRISAAAMVTMAR